MVYRHDKNEYVVISGAAMALLGIKDHTSDIDIAVTEEYYDYLLKNVLDAVIQKILIYNFQAKQKKIDKNSKKILDKHFFQIYT